MLAINDKMHLSGNLKIEKKNASYTPPSRSASLTSSPSPTEVFLKERLHCHDVWLQNKTYLPSMEIRNTAISINVVGLNLQTYESRPNGAMGIYSNLHITIEEIYKFVFLHVEYLFFFP